MLAYKCFAVILVPPAYTSQTCNVCGVVDAANCTSQSKFLCVSCGHADHADLNAVANIGLRDWGNCTGRGVRVTDPCDP